MKEDNVLEFCQWLISEKGIDAGNLSDYINNNEEEVLKLAEEFKKPKFKIGGKINVAAEKFQGGGKTSRADYKEQKISRRDLRNNVKENYGFNNDQFTLSYLNLKNQFRNNGLDRRAAKLAAQRAMYTKDTPSVEIPQMEMPVYSYQPAAKSYSYTDFEDLTDFEPMDIKGMGYDSMSFSDAFAAARRAGGNTGNNTFVWRGNTYGTKYKNEVSPVKPANDNHIYNGGSIDEVVVTAPRTINNPKSNAETSLTDDIIDGGVMRDVIVTAPGVVDGGMIDEVVVTSPGKSSRQPRFRTKTMPGRFGLAHYACGGKAKNKIKKHADGNPLTLGPIKIDDDRDGYVSYNNDGSVKSSIYRRTEPWQGTYQPSMALTHRVTSPDSVAMYVQYGPADEESRRGYLYNTARHMGAREIANREKFDQMFNDLESKAGMRVVALPNNKYVIRDVVHTPDDTMTRVVDPEKQDTVIMTQDLKRYSNKDIGTRIKRAVGLESKFDKLNKLFNEFDFEFKYGGSLNNINKK